MDRDNSILFQVAFKAAIEVFVSGNTETDDVIGEVTGLTDVFFDFLSERTGSDSPSQAAPKKKSTAGRSTTSKAAASKSKSSGSVAPKDPTAPATEPQVKFLKRLLKENDVEYDADDFMWDGDWVSFGDLTKGSIQQYIDPLVN